jgi:hypothetical protein
MCIDQRPVDPKSSQRRPGPHADSFPTGRVDMIRNSDSIYLAYDCLGTEFCIGDFTFNADVDTSNNNSIIDHFESRTESVKVYDPYKIIHMDSGHVHRVSFNNTDATILRTFIKITFSPDIFNRVGNDHNYLLDYNWPLYLRTIERNNNSIMDGYVNLHEFLYISHDQLADHFEHKIALDLADDKIIKIRREGIAYIHPAIEGDLLVTNNTNGEFMTCLTAKKGDWKLFNPKTKAKYFMSLTKIKELYDIEIIPKIVYLVIKAKSTIALAFKINRSVRIDAPWKVPQYLRSGDYIVKRANGEIYGVTSMDVGENYKIEE